MFKSKDDTPDLYLRYNALWRATELAVAMLTCPNAEGNIDSDKVVGTARKYYDFLKGETK